jgi:hypothetical protein
LSRATESGTNTSTVDDESDESYVTDRSLSDEENSQANLSRNQYLNKQRKNSTKIGEYFGDFKYHHVKKKRKLYSYWSATC